MLKHCQATALDSSRRSAKRASTSSSKLSANFPICNNNDNSSLNSSGNSSLFNSSFCLQNKNESADDRLRPISTQPNLNHSMVSRTGSFLSLSLVETSNSASPQPKMTPIKIFAKCLRPDIEYKTLSVSRTTTSRELIWLLLSKVKMKHRDPNLFYLTMDISVKSLRSTTLSSNSSSLSSSSLSSNEQESLNSNGELVRTIVLEDDARPAELKSCHPWGVDDCRFTLQTREGSLVRVYDSVLMAESKYKCLLIAETTTVKEVIRILFHCYNMEKVEDPERYVIVEQCASRAYERRLNHTDRPAQVQSLWPKSSQFMFVLKRQQHFGDEVAKNNTKAAPPPPQAFKSQAYVNVPTRGFSPMKETPNERFSPAQQHQQPMSLITLPSKPSLAQFVISEEATKAIVNKQQQKPSATVVHREGYPSENPSEMYPKQQVLISSHRFRTRTSPVKAEHSNGPVIAGYNKGMDSNGPLSLPYFDANNRCYTPQSIHEIGLPSKPPPPPLRPKPTQQQQPGNPLGNMPSPPSTSTVGLLFSSTRSSPSPTQIGALTRENLTQSQQIQNHRASLGSLSSGSSSNTSSTSHEYENYFYI